MTSVAEVSLSNRRVVARSWYPVRFLGWTGCQEGALSHSGGRVAPGQGGAATAGGLSYCGDWLPRCFAKGDATCNLS